MQGLQVWLGTVVASSTQVSSRGQHVNIPPVYRELCGFDSCFISHTASFFCDDDEELRCVRQHLTLLFLRRDSEGEESCWFVRGKVP